MTTCYNLHIKLMLSMFFKQSLETYCFYSVYYYFYFYYYYNIIIIIVIIIIMLTVTREDCHDNHER